jgi:hypothetical protein
VLIKTWGGKIDGLDKFGLGCNGWIKTIY